MHHTVFTGRHEIGEAGEIVLFDFNGFAGFIEKRNAQKQNNRLSRKAIIL